MGGRIVFLQAHHLCSLINKHFISCCCRELSQALKEGNKAGQYGVMSSGDVKKGQSSKLDGDLVLSAGEDPTPAPGIQRLAHGSQSFLSLVF